MPYWMRAFIYLITGFLSVGSALLLVSQTVDLSFSQETTAPADSSSLPPVPPPVAAESADAVDPMPLETTSDEALAEAEAARPRKDLEAFLPRYNYDPEGRRDPFEFLVGGSGSEGGPVGPLLPIQNFALDQLNLVGVIWNVEDPKAMFTDPQNKVHLVGRNDRIGRNNGYIAVIREGEVVVVEPVTIRGELVYTTRVIKIN